MVKQPQLVAALVLPFMTVRSAGHVHRQHHGHPGAWVLRHGSHHEEHWHHKGLDGAWVLRHGSHHEEHLHHKGLGHLAGLRGLLGHPHGHKGWSPDRVDRAVSEGHAVSAACNWTVYYDSLDPAREAQPYGEERGLMHHGLRPAGRSVGIGCLERCCHDSSCQALAMNSDLVDASCHKYAEVPNVSSAPGEPLEAFLAWGMARPTRQSVFVKSASHGTAPALLVSPGLHGKALVGEVNASGFHAPAVLREAPPCNWTVHYDTRAPAKDVRPYGRGARDCLEVCCHDPTCRALEVRPSGHGHHGECNEISGAPLLDSAQRPLGGGSDLANPWTVLHDKPHQWSVLVKASSAAPLVRAASTTAASATGAQAPRDRERPAEEGPFAGGPQAGPAAVGPGGLGLGPQVRTRAGPAAKGPLGDTEVAAAPPTSLLNLSMFQILFLLLIVYALAKFSGFAGKRASSTWSQPPSLTRLRGGALRGSKCPDL